MNSTIFRSFAPMVPIYFIFMDIFPLLLLSLFISGVQSVYPPAEPYINDVEMESKIWQTKMKWHRNRCEWVCINIIIIIMNDYIRICFARTIYVSVWLWLYVIEWIQDLQIQLHFYSILAKQTWWMYRTNKRMANSVYFTASHCYWFDPSLLVGIFMV